MNVVLGNLQLKDIVRDEYIDVIQAFLHTNGYQREPAVDRIGDKDANYHIYAMPRIMVFGNKAKIVGFYEFLEKKGLADKVFKARLGLSYVRDDEKE